MQLYRSIFEPIRYSKDPDFLWRESDRGLLWAWELGRITASKDFALRRAAEAGALPELHFKGGFNKRLKQVFKYGSLHYFAMWQGLRNQDLDIDDEKEPVLVCQETGMCVVYTIDPQKYLLPELPKSVIDQLDGKILQVALSFPDAKDV